MPAVRSERVEDGVELVTLDRPRANAIDVATSHALHDAFAAAEADPAVRVTVDEVPELVGAEDLIERLVPGHVAQRHIDGALYRRVDDHVQPADFREGPQYSAQVRSLKVEADRIAREAPLAGRQALARQARV